MSVDQLVAPARILRNEPIQARSTARLEALLDAAAGIVDEIGFERLTTAMVAERAAASIGTVYRYFPDRIALLQSLASRNLDRVLTRVTDGVVDPRQEDWHAALNAAFAILVDAYRNEPGFRGLRVGDVLDLRPPPRRPDLQIDRGRSSPRRIGRALRGARTSPEIRFRFETGRRGRRCTRHKSIRIRSGRGRGFPRCRPRPWSTRSSPRTSARTDPFRASGPTGFGPDPHHVTQRHDGQPV